MPATIRKDMYEDLDKARTKAWMIHRSCEAMELAITGEDYRPGAVWFEGAKHVFREIAETITETWGYLEPEDAEPTED